MQSVEIYTQPGCGYCARALKLLRTKPVDLHEIDAPGGSEARQAAIARSGGSVTVPQIFIGTRHIGGCDDLFALERRGELDALLRAA